MNSSETDIESQYIPTAALVREENAIEIVICPVQIEQNINITSFCLSKIIVVLIIALICILFAVL